MTAEHPARPADEIRADLATVEDRRARKLPEWTTTLGGAERWTFRLAADAEHLLSEVEQLRSRVSELEAMQRTETVIAATIDRNNERVKRQQAEDQRDVALARAEEAEQTVEEFRRLAAYAASRRDQEHARAEGLAAEVERLNRQAEHMRAEYVRETAELIEAKVDAEAEVERLRMAVTVARKHLATPPLGLVGKAGKVLEAALTPSAREPDGLCRSRPPRVENSPSGPPNPPKWCTKPKGHDGDHEHRRFTGSGYRWAAVTPPECRVGQNSRKTPTPPDNS